MNITMNDKKLSVLCEEIDKCLPLDIRITVEINNDCQITCYEIKVSWEDLNSKKQINI